MNSCHALRPPSLAGLACLAAASACAQDGGHFYGGLLAGQSRARIDEARIAARLLDAGLSNTTVTRDPRDKAFKLFGGYQFNRNLGLEAGYFDLGRFGFTAATLPAGTLNGEIRLRGLNLDLVGTLPLRARLSVIARVGLQNARAGGTFSGTGAASVLNPDPSERSTHYKLGAGLQYAVSPSFLLRVEAERYRVSDLVGQRGAVNLFSVSAVLPFGRAP